MRIVRRPALLDDIADSYAWIANENEVAAERLLDRIEATVTTLEKHPFIGAPRSRLGAGLRSMQVRPFRHLLFYRIDGEDLILVRLLHGARNLPAQDFDD